MADDIATPGPGDPMDELLGAYALDAVDERERRLVEEYLVANPRARDEVQAHREVAALLSFSGGEAPEGVWDRIARELDGRAPAPGPELARVLPLAPQGARSRWRGAVLGVAAAAIAAAAAVVITLAVDDDPPGRDSERAIVEAYGEAWADPDARRADLASDDGALQADAVIEAGGLGFLSARGLPALPDDETYQLWGVYSDGDVISLGVIGNRPGIEPFTARGDIDALVITREQAGGVVSSTSGALLVGELS